MNGYLSLCGGDPCPPVFSSPVVGMDDIMDNQVICAIYRLPDYHNHISRPPVGVKIPKKTVTVDDLQPEPALWHEDTGRKPWENGRNGNRPYNNNNHHNHSHTQNPHGATSGRQLGEAAHRLVTNSLQVKPDRNNHHQAYDPHAHHGPPPPYQPYQNSNRPYNQPPRSGYPPHNYDWSYNQPYASDTNYNNRSNPQTHGYQHGYAPRGPHQGQQQYYPQQGGAYNNSGGGYGYNNGAANNQGGWAPRGNQGGGRGPSRPQHGGGNQFSVLNRDGANRRHHQR
uniref:5'-3' exoribonuclease 3 n=1 Tax=Tanacetum cinerariifolium TaxID=118510 RepID=A0A6L2JL44_TANCI|nr:5'-3' exoribonuclease 3 [Tanacetum cinerariifolium]